MSFSFAGIDHVQLAAPPGGEAEARRFYADILGWAELPKPAPLRQRGGVWFQCGEHQVHIGIEKEFRPSVKAHPAFRVRRLELLRERLERHGIEAIDDDARADEGISRFYIRDPFGNRLEFME